MTASRPSHSETLSLTGLRGLAALSVLVAHYSVWCAPYDRATAPGWLARGLDYSAWGMSLFFTLSGFVIAYNYLTLDWRDRAAASAGRFAWLRFSRLYPVLLVYLALLYVRPSNYGDDALAAQSLLLVSVESLYPFKINGHWLTDPLCWSISTEIALYTIFVGCIVAFRKARLRFGGAAIVIAAGLVVFYLTAMAWLILHQQAMLPALALLPPAFDPITPEEGAHWFFYWSPYVRFYDFAFGWMAAIAVLRGFRLPPWLDDGVVPLCCGALWLAWVTGMIWVRDQQSLNRCCHRFLRWSWSRDPPRAYRGSFRPPDCCSLARFPIRSICSILLPPIWLTMRAANRSPGLASSISAAPSRSIS